MLLLQGIDSRGLYSDSVPEVKGFYQSYSYIDDLAWAAAWLAMRTRDAEDIKSAQFYVQQHISEEAGGDRRRWVVQSLAVVCLVSTTPRPLSVARAASPSQPA